MSGRYLDYAASLGEIRGDFQKIDLKPHWTEFARVVVGIEGKPDQEGLANARRVVAAWNATRGIPTEALELGAVAMLVEYAGRAWAALEAIREDIPVVSRDYDCGKVADDLGEILAEFRTGPPETVESLLLAYDELSGAIHDADRGVIPPQRLRDVARGHGWDGGVLIRDFARDVLRRAIEKARGGEGRP